jgi:hypothetical protein
MFSARSQPRCPARRLHDFMSETPVVDSVAVKHHPGLASMYAGLGATTGFLFFLAAANFLSDIFDQIVALCISTLVIALFVEPLIERAASPLHPGEARHRNAPATWTRRIVTFAVLAITGLSHHLVDEIVTQSPWAAIGLMFSALLLPGGITYFWILGARRRPSRAAGYGLMGGIIIGGLFFFLVFVFTNGRMLAADPSGQVTLAEMPFSSAEMAVVFNAMPWILCGFFGGLAVDRKWGKRPAVGVPITLIALIVILEVVAKIFAPDVLFRAMGLDVMRVAGWAAGIWLYVPTNAMLTNSRT